MIPVKTIPGNDRSLLLAIPAEGNAFPADIWQQILQGAFRSSRTLLEFLQLPQSTNTVEHGIEIDPNPDFPVLVPMPLARRIKPGDFNDPILKQILATQEENNTQPGFVDDPLMETNPDSAFSQAPGLIQKYHGRVLIITTSGCAVNCRYCFRRHFPYAEHREAELNSAFAAIAGDPSIEEVILSGGDPLLLKDQNLAKLIERIEAIKHVKRLRIHTRIPVVLPQRVTAQLVKRLQSSKLKIIVVIHANHAQELDRHTAHALDCLKQAGILLLNQSVLLAGVNDSAACQIALAHRLFEQHVLPYYLHLPDRVRGTHHFYVNTTQGIAIHQQMQAKLPGFLLPKLVREEPNKSSKTIVTDK